ncbi:DUF2955 domain-containing protein [Ferrimonas sp. SCSIO 43195]|uniref:DUF2955 domain-containing protein n=1 Tax=Ferrimonas sp. SCSIO 43195 TaxID=2822844 RepID=UPI0020759593|nr:DUF2955 domain-containing protein [Ferrimonas sp. SCSIO 43195]USD39432.1 DUF2955 domain-containing protein [Ferrimonas sp. SCSIO 43195]
MLKRLWLGACLAFALCTLTSWRYGAMFTPLFSIVLLSRLNQWHGLVARQLIQSIVTACLIANLILGFLQPFPLLMLTAVALWMAINCFSMTHPGSFMLGFVNLVIGSILLNVGSFDGFDLLDFSLDLVASALAAIAVTALMFLLFPGQAAPQATASEPPASATLLHNLTLSWWMVMLLFVAFQLLDLSDSLSAQAAAVILLTPMNLTGSAIATRARIVGTVIGCSAALSLQLLLFSYIDNLALYLLGFSLFLGPFAYWVCQGGESSAIGFAGISSLVVLMSGVTPGQQDLFFATLYRFNSTLALVIVTALAFALLHRWRPLSAPT